MPKDYSYAKSEYWGDGHWIIKTSGRDLGRASKQDNGKWSAYTEIMVTPGDFKATPVAVDLDSIDAVYRALTTEVKAEEKRHVLRSGPLPGGWHRVTWVEDGIPRYILTEDIVSAVFVEGAMKRKHTVKDVIMSSWDNYAFSQWPTIEIKEK
jgi:hypothetical protein